MHEFHSISPDEDAYNPAKGEEKLSFIHSGGESFSYSLDLSTVQHIPYLLLYIGSPYHRVHALRPSHFSRRPPCEKPLFPSVVLFKYLPYQHPGKLLVTSNMADALQALAAELNHELKHESTQTTREHTETTVTKADDLVIELPPQDSVPPTTGNSQAQSPLSAKTQETPGTEVSDIEALDKEFSAIGRSPSKENARAKAATLSLIEQVSHVVVVVVVMIGY